MYLVFDIGGTKTRLASSYDGKTILSSEVIPTEMDFEKAIEQIKEVAKKLTNGQKITKAAGGIRALDPTKTKLVDHPYIKMWVNKPLKNTLEEILDTQVFLENDAAMAGLGEASQGAGSGAMIVAYITIGTGIGGVRIVNKKIDVSMLGFEPGQQILNIDNDLYPYYNGLGYLESYISGKALEKRFKAVPQQLTNPEVWNEVGKYLAIGLNNTIVHWSPDLVVLGGGMAGMIPLESVNFHLKQALKIFPKAPEIVKAKLGDQAAFFGALEYLKQRS